MSFRPIAPGLSVVAIVGRPNVGKSTLFNRLMREQIAITDPTPGVTRDPIQRILSLEGGSCILVDTGGYMNLSEADEIGSAVTEKSLDVIKESDLILFMIDVNETGPLDDEMAQHLRRYSNRTVLLVNKVDHESHLTKVANHYEYGFDGVIPVSAEHGVGYQDILDIINTRVELKEPIAVENLPRRILLLGKPNTGKSTLSNALTGSERSIVSEIPGTTRDATTDSFEYHHQSYTLTDCAGIRRKSKVTEDLEYYTVNRAIGQIEESDLVFLMVDISDNITDQDKKIAAQIVKKGKGVIIVLNKTDILSSDLGTVKQMVSRARFLFPVLAFAPVVCISAKEKTGLDELMKEAGIVYKQMHKRVDTGLLNRSLKKWLDSNPPPLSKNHRKINIKYMTQPTANPVRFVIFSGRKNELPEFYRLYLLNKLRLDLGFTKVPVDLSVK